MPRPLLQLVRPAPSPTPLYGRGWEDGYSAARRRDSSRAFMVGVVVGAVVMGISLSIAMGVA